MDALTHNVESYLSPAYHPLCDGIALEGARIAAQALETAVHEPKNLRARSDMMMSSMMGAIAFQKDLGAVHSCAHALGTVVDMHHGLANGIMIDHVMRFNADAAGGKTRGARACLRVGDRIGATSSTGSRRSSRASGFRRSWVPGVSRAAHVPRLVEIAVADTCHQTNPKPVSARGFRAHLPVGDIGATRNFRQYGRR